MNKLFFLLGFFVLLNISIAGQKNVLYCADFNTPVTLVPGATTSTEKRICQFIFDSLVVQTDDKNYTLSLAEEVDVSPDSLSYTFLLHKNIKWQDGKPLTARDIQFTFELLLNSKSDNYDPVLEAFIDDVAFVNPKVITITLTRPFYDPLSLFTFKILPQHIIQKNYLNKTDGFAKNPLGCGPYQYASGLSKKEIVLIKNKYFNYRKRPFFDKIIFRIYKNTSKASKDFRDNKIHILPYATKDIFDKKVNNVKNTNQNIHFLKFNYTPGHRYEKLFNNRSFRLALLKCIDRKSISEHFSEKKRNISLLSGPFPNASWFDNKEIKIREYKAKEARRLIKKISKKNGHKKLTFRIACINNKDALLALDKIVSYLKEVGIDIKRVDQNDSFDLFYDILTFKNTTDIIKLFSLQNTNKRKNVYQNSRLTELLYELHSVLNPWAIQKITQKIHSFIHKEVPCIFLWQLDSYVTYNKKIHHMKLHPNHLFNFPEYWKWK